MRKITADQIRMTAGTKVLPMDRSFKFLLIDQWRLAGIAVTGKTIIIAGSFLRGCA